MEKDNVFRLTCSCGCGDGFEARAAHGTLYVSFFRSDWYAQQHAFRSAVSDKMKYMKGDRLLREVVVSREDLIAFRDFLKEVKWENTSDYKNSSHITPMHLLDEIYALWLEGDLPEFAVLKGKFHQMFELELSEMDRDVLVMKIDKWLSREEWHAIPVGESPHVDRITAGITDDDDDEEVIVEDNELTEDNSESVGKIVPEEVITPTDEVNCELWCDNQQLDNKNEVMCLAHLADGRVLSCPYKTLVERNESEFPCSDYMPIEDIIEETEEDKSEDDVVIRRVAVEDIVPRAREEYEESIDEPSNDDEVELPDDAISENDVVDASDEDVAQLDEEDVLFDDDPVETETDEVVSSDDESSDDDLIPDETLEEVSDENELSEVEENEREGKTESGE